MVLWSMYRGIFFPFNHIDDECIFLRVISEIYHSECKTVNPFEIDEDDSNILEYQGDLDPDKCLFNQHSQSLMEACNYQTVQTCESERYFQQWIFSIPSFENYHYLL